jgi:putative transcriptional regulator
MSPRFTNRFRVFLVYLISTASLISATGAAGAENQPDAGMFLVATPDLENSGFSETVILLVQHDEQGTMGLVINQPSDVEVAALWPDVSDLNELDGRLYIGGPVATYGIMLLLRSKVAPANAEHVFADVYASGSRELLLEMTQAGVDSATIRLYAGHAGWSPGQLDYEISRGSWQVLPASESMIFSDEPANIWRRLAPVGRPMIVMAH